MKKFKIVAILTFLCLALTGCLAHNEAAPNEEIPAGINDLVQDETENEDMIIYNCDEGSAFDLDEDEMPKLIFDDLIRVVYNDDGSIGDIWATRARADFTTFKVHNENDAMRLLRQVLPEYVFYNQGVEDIIHTHRTNSWGEEHQYQLTPIINDIPVSQIFTTLIAREDGSVFSISSNFDSRINHVNTAPTITQAEAEEIAIDAFVQLFIDRPFDLDPGQRCDSGFAIVYPRYHLMDSPGHDEVEIYLSSLIIEDVESIDDFRLIWRVEIPFSEDSPPAGSFFWPELTHRRVYHILANGEDAGIVTRDFHSPRVH